MHRLAHTRNQDARASTCPCTRVPSTASDERASVPLTPLARSLFRPLRAVTHDLRSISELRFSHSESTRVCAALSH
eukprot:1729588-Pleurochrysis_carterae.AAC.1